MMMEIFFFASFFFVDKPKFVDKQKERGELCYAPGLRPIARISPRSLLTGCKGPNRILGFAY